MSYIGKVKVSSAWTKLEDLIQAQVDGQSSFAFDTSKTYSVQADTQAQVGFGAYVCNSATEPTNDDDGEYLTEGLFGVYKPSSGVYLYVRARGNSTNTKISVSEQD